MARLIYIFDTNAISDLILQNVNVISRVRRNQAQVMCLCAPVHYEVRRGLLYSNASRKIHIYETQIRPEFEWLILEDVDWEVAARLWAEARRKGKQLSEVDLLLSALAQRLDAVIVSSDQDFDAVAIRRENWRE